MTRHIKQEETNPPKQSKHTQHQMPFLTRNMLKYGPEATFELQIRHQGNIAGTFQVSGGTRSALISTNISFAADAGAVTTTIRIDDFPIFLAVSSTDVANVQGALFVTINVLINGEIVACLLSGNVTEARPLTWPAQNLHEQIPNRGEISIVVSDDPATDAEVSLTLDNNEIWLVHWASIQLTTANPGGNRVLHIKFTADTAGEIDMFANSAQAGNLTRLYHAAQYGDLGDPFDDNDILIPLPNNLWLEPSTVITTDVSVRQTGDDLGPLTIMREKFYVGN